MGVDTLFHFVNSSGVRNKATEPRYHCLPNCVCNAHTSQTSQFLLGIFVIFESTYQFLNTVLRDCNHCLQSL